MYIRPCVWCQRQARGDHQDAADAHRRAQGVAPLLRPRPEHETQGLRLASSALPSHLGVLNTAVPSPLLFCIAFSRMALSHLSLEVCKGRVRRRGAFARVSTTYCTSSTPPLCVAGPAIHYGGQTVVPPRHVRALQRPFHDRARPRGRVRYGGIPLVLRPTSHLHSGTPRGRWILARIQHARTASFSIACASLGPSLCLPWAEPVPGQLEIRRAGVFHTDAMRPPSSCASGFHLTRLHYALLPGPCLLGA